MKKKLKFFISFLLVIIIAISAFIVPVSSYENEVKTSSVSMLLVNLDTDTVCFSQLAPNKWYASYMSELMTFIVAAERNRNPEEVTVEVKQDFIYDLPYSDGSLDLFVGKKLTLKDLMTIMMLTPGSDAAYLIAATVSGGDIDGFVELMNKKADSIGCKLTHYLTPGYSESSDHYTCCNDMYLIFKSLYTIDLYQEIMKSPNYTPEGYEDDDNTYEVTTENSILNPASPYYFRYATGGKYSYSITAGANIFVTTRYRGKSYFFVALRGKNKSEQNVFADARRMTSWGYLNLTDRKVIDVDDAVSEYNITTDWGSYSADLYASNAAFKTLPKEYDENMLTYSINIPEGVPLPVFEGQSIGTAKIYYGKEKIDDVNLISGSSEGIDLLSDLSHFALYSVSEILINEPPTEAPTEAPTAAPTVPPTAPADFAEG